MKSEDNRINQMECDMAEVKTDIKYIKSNIEEIKEFMSDNICRCGAYPNIVAAITEVKNSGQKI